MTFSFFNYKPKLNKYQIYVISLRSLLKIAKSWDVYCLFLLLNLIYQTKKQSFKKIQPSDGIKNGEKNIINWIKCRKNKTMNIRKILNIKTLIILYAFALWLMIWNFSKLCWMPRLKAELCISLLLFCYKNSTDVSNQIWSC